MKYSFLHKSLIITSILLGIYSTVWSLYDMVYAHRYFTNQSVLLVLISLIVVTLSPTSKRWHSYLGFAALISILLSSIVFHILLADGPIAFKGHLSHTLIPLLYFIYFFVYAKAPTFNHLYLGIIHPLLYFAFFLIFGGFLNYYPYDFINVSKNGLTSVLMTSLGIILPISIVFALGLLYIKKQWDAHQKSLSK